VCVGFENVLHILLYGIVYIFSHPTYLQEACNYSVLLKVHAGSQNILSILLHGPVCIFSYPTHMRKTGNYSVLLNGRIAASGVIFNKCPQDWAHYPHISGVTVREDGKNMCDPSRR